MMSFKQITFSILLIFFAAGNVFSQGLNVTKRDIGGENFPCLSPGEAQLNSQEIVASIDIQAPIASGPQLNLPNLLPMFINAYLDGDLVFSQSIPATFNHVAASCSPIYNNINGTYRSQAFDVEAALDAIDIKCGEEMLFIEGKIDVLFETIQFDGSFTTYPVQTYPNFFYCKGGANTSGSFEYVLCCSGLFFNEDGEIESRNKRQNNFKESIFIAPNPFTSYLKLEPDVKIEQLIISDVSGNVIYSGAPKKIFLTDNWKAGVYLCSYFDGQKWNSKRMIKL